MRVDDLAVRVAETAEVAENGPWQRHVAARWARQALDGRKGYGRWGTPTGFPVLYLGRPTESVVIEAYRHLVDPVDIDEPAGRETLLDNLLPRVLVTCTVTVTRLIDLRSAAARAHVGLTLQELTSATSDVDAYRRCQTVAQVAHQLGRHGILAPAATGRGDTLALFPDLLPPEEWPVRSGDDEHWTRLPADPRSAPPRTLRLVPRGG